LRSHVPRSNTHGGGNCSSTRVFRMPILNTHNLDAGIEAILLFEDHQKMDDSLTITAAKIQTGYRVSAAYLNKATGKHRNKIFNLVVPSNFRNADKWNVDIVVGAALRLFSSFGVETIHSKFSSKGLANQLFHYLKRMTNRKEGKFILQKYEIEGRKYQSRGRRNTHYSDEKPSNTGVREGMDGTEVSSNDSMQVCRDIKERAQPIPSKSIFSPEPSGTTYAIVGKSFSGKTTFIVNQLNALSEDELKKYNAIIFFTESANSDPLKTLSTSVKEKMILTDRFCPKILQVLKKIQDATHNKFKFLVIFDDIIKLRGELLTQCILTLRNSNISTAISIQYEKLMNPAQRSSVHNMYIFNLRTESWEYMLKGFVLGNVKELVPALSDEKKVSVVAQKMRQCMDDYILHYDQRRDQIVLWNKK